jgi:hypothetical protein
LNIGSGLHQTIRKPGELVAEVIGFKSQLTFNANKLDRTPRKLLDISRPIFLRLGAKNKPSRRLEDGLSRFPGVAKRVHSEYRGTSRDRALKLHRRDETKNQFCGFSWSPRKCQAWTVDIDSEAWKSTSVALPMTGSA